jgi:hypothetical protein
MMKTELIKAIVIAAVRRRSLRMAVLSARI